MKNIRTAIIGAGYRGRYLITLLQKINLFDIIAVSDISPNPIRNYIATIRGRKDS